MATKKVNYQSLEGFEKRMEKLECSYRSAVISVNKMIKDTRTTFDYQKSDVKCVLLSLSKSPQMETYGLSQEEISILRKYCPQALAILGRMTGNEEGLRTTSQGSHTAFYILQYLYAYCKRYEYKQKQASK